MESESDNDSLMSEDVIADDDELDQVFLEDEEVYEAIRLGLIAMKKSLTQKIGDRLTLRKIGPDEVLEFMDYLWHTLVEDYSEDLESSA